MGQAIRVGLILVAVAAIFLVLSPFIDQFSSLLPAIGNGLSEIVSVMSPYLAFGRSLLNLLVGNAVIVDSMLWFIFIAPLSLHAATLIVKIYKKIVG